MKSTIKYKAINIKSIIRVLFILLLLSTSISQTYAQTVEELDAKLNILCCDEGNIPELEIKYRDIARELLRIDTANKKASMFLYRSFNERGEKDSIKVFLNKLDEDYKKKDDSMKDILLMLNIFPSASFKDTMKYEYEFKEIDKYKKLYLKDSLDEEVIYNIAENYYRIFNKSIQRQFRNDSIDNYVKLVIFYTEKLCKLKPEYLEAYKYPLIQLRYFLGEKDTAKLFEEYKTNNYPYYFPLIGFANYPKDWLKDYSVDLFYQTYRYLVFRNGWYKSILKQFEEERLYLKQTKKEIFRFTWLRSFDDQIVIRVEKDGDDYYLIQKIGRFKDYESNEIVLKKNTKKKISKKEWDEFMLLTNKIQDWNIPHSKIGIDGAQWVYEYLASDSYKIINRFSPNKESEFAAIGLYLIKLCGLEKEDIY